MIARELGEGEIERVLLENGANSDMVSPSKSASNPISKSTLTGKDV